MVLSVHLYCLQDDDLCFRKLPNGLGEENKEVCLFVKDLDRTDREYEQSVRHFKAFLKSKGISCVSEVCLLRYGFCCLFHEEKKKFQRLILASFSCKPSVVMHTSSNWLFFFFFPPPLLFFFFF